MVSLQVEALAAVLDSPNQDCLPRAVIIERLVFCWRSLTPAVGKGHEVENGGREPADLHLMLAAHVASHRERFEIHLRTGNGRADVQEDASFEALHAPRENQKVIVAGFS